MTQQESSEEANHFEQVLGRLDALLKRNQPLDTTPEDTPTMPVETAGSDIPVLTEVYAGEGPVTLLADTGDVPAPVLTEIAEPLEQSEQTSGQMTGDVPLPDAYFGSLAAVPPSEALPQPATGAALDDDAIVEKTLTILMPLLQDALDRVVREEIERALSEITASVTQRLHAEIREEIEWVLRERLQEMLDEGGK
jgi:hypothetical protein